VADINVAGVIGTGAFGAVKLCRHRINGEMCALKVTHRNNAARAQKEGRRVESDAQHILEKLSHPFIVRTFCTYWEGDEVCTLMELVEGGEMYQHFNPQNPMPASTAKIYLAQLVLALDTLHKNGVVYHDLKPNNMLATKDGDVKIIDFGLATVGSAGGKDKCSCGSGTAPYMAPELLASRSHDRMVDWWALGVVAFEFMAGGRPFDSETMGGISKKACKGVVWATWQVNGFNFTKEARDLIDMLLSVDPTGRLCYQRGVTEIKKHAFFHGLDWDRLERGKVTPPFAPGVRIDAGGGMAGAVFAAGGGKVQAHTDKKKSKDSEKVEQKSRKASDIEGDFRKKHK